MNSRTFIQILELAHERLYGEKGDVRLVPYDPAPGDMSVPVTECIGMLLTHDQHMANIAAEGMYIIWEDRDAEWNDDADKDEALGDFRDLIGSMRVAPFMSWTCIYFPGITMDDIETGRDPSNVLGGIPPGELAWNTGRQYSAKGQRIGAVTTANGDIVFHDIDRGIFGRIEDDHHFDKDSIMEAYDRGYYINDLSSSDADVERAKNLAEKL